MKKELLYVLLCAALLLCMACFGLAQGIPAWQPGTAYAVGAQVMFNGVDYQCIQAHTSQLGWEPPNAPALWKPVSAPSPTPTPTATPTPTPTPTPVPTATPTPTPTTGGSCFAPWSSSQVYTAGMTASLNGINYTANFWNQNQSPATNSGSPGSGAPWSPNGPCSGTPPPSPTPTPTPTPTPCPFGTLPAPNPVGISPTSVSLATAASDPLPGQTCPQPTYAWFENGTLLTSTGGPSFTATGLTPSTTYTFTVAFVVNGKIGPQSGPTTVTTPPAPTPTPTPTPGGGPNISCTASPWDSTTAYSGGMQATFNGFLWQANFFTQGNQPMPQESGPWKVVGICGQLPGPNPSRLAAPYVDVTLPLFMTVTSMNPVPVKFLTLAFVIAQNGCQASWAGTLPIPATGTPPLIDHLNAYRAAGGDFGISFGGAAGQELALVCSDANSLVTQYQNVINQYHPKFIDFDLETSATNDTIREQAIATLQKNNPNLAVSYTLQTEPTGINGLANTILQDAVSAGVHIGIVNVLSMDLGGAFDNGGQMGLSAQRSGWSVEDTLMNLFPGKTRTEIAAMVGVTVMIGTNDNEAEIFQLSDINTLVQTGLDNGWGRISIWSVTRDQDCRTVPGIGVLTPQPASGECSGVAQNQFQYSTAFNAFNP